MATQTTDDSAGWILAKIASVWAAVGVTSWAEAASALAFFYTLCLLANWWWTKFWRPLLEKHGIINSTTDLMP